MLSATINLDPAYIVGPVRPRLFGSFVEHLGRCVYTGIYEPEHPTATPEGFRRDVLDLIAGLGVTTVRYPGGNFVSGYRWEDGVGPQEERPARLDLAWHSTEPNQVGVNEFMAWCSLADVEPMMAVNLGTRGVPEALDLLEYTTIKGGTALSELRRSHGVADPHPISMWCLGNEMDGPWQTGHKTAREYGRLAAETARAMRQVNPDLELIACGSSSLDMPTFGAWELDVLEETYDLVDMISAHRYYALDGEDLASFLASAVDLDRFIESIAACADAIGAKLHSTKRIGISVDEWNVWYQDAAPSQPPSGDDWPIAPRLLEDRYSVADAVVVGGLLISLLRHADRVQAASLAQLVNVIAPIMTQPGGPAWRQTTYHPFAQAASLARGQVLQAAVCAPCQATAKYGDVSIVDAVATYDDTRESLAVFLVNRSTSDDVRVSIDLRAWGEASHITATTMTHADLSYTVHGPTDPEVLPVPVPAKCEDHTILLDLPRGSWNTLSLTIPCR